MADLDPSEDHGGHEVHVIHWFRGSNAILECPPCAKCGGRMELVEGEHPAEHPLIEDSPERLTEREDVKAELRKLGLIP